MKTLTTTLGRATYHVGGGPLKLMPDGFIANLSSEAWFGGLNRILDVAWCANALACFAERLLSRR